jgi:Flp pilus assembly protein TadB
VIVGLALGAGVGFGAFLIGRALLVRRMPLAVALAMLDRPRVAPAGTDTALGDRSSRWEHRIGRRTVRVLESVGLDLARLHGDLRITGRTVERHAVDKAAAAVAGLGTPLVMAAVVRAGGASLPIGLVTVAALGFGVAGFFLPDVLLRDAARSRRAAFATALSAYLDLVNVLLAGSAGTETALVAAAEAGDGWAFAELRAVLVRADATRRSPWDAFAGLGAELGVNELQELAASVRLAGEQGARIRSSLAAKAASLRGQQLARAEASAQAASERMAVPNVLMFLGFLAFAGYPAIASIIGGV